MATAYGDVVERSESADQYDRDLCAPEPTRWDQFILTAALAIVAGLLLSDWMNGPAIRTLTDDSQMLERALSPDGPTT
jgi:hypothetical protein